MISQKRIDRAFDYYPRLAKVREYVIENLSEPISLNDAARVASMQPSSFSRLFKDKTGITFSEWIRRERIAKAIEILEKRVISVSSLAARVGFSCERTFRRAFIVQTGVSPSYYKKSIWD